MSSEGPLSSTDEPPLTASAHEASGPAEERGIGRHKEQEARARDEDLDEEGTVQSSLLSLDTETAQAAQDVLDSETEVCTPLQWARPAVFAMSY